MANIGLTFGNLQSSLKQVDHNEMVFTGAFMSGHQRVENSGRSKREAWVPAFPALRPQNTYGSNIQNMRGRGGGGGGPTLVLARGLGPILYKEIWIQC